MTSSYTPLLRKLPIPAIFVDLEGIARIASEPATEMGYLEGEKIETPWLREFLASTEPTQEVVVQCKDSWWQVQLSRVEDGVVIVATDISGQITLQQTLANLNRQQSTISLQALRHDAQTFLNGIDYYLMMAGEESGCGEVIGKAQGCVDRLRLLLESLSYFYGAGASKKRRLVFRELVESSLDTLRPKVEQAKAQISIEGNGTMVWGEPGRLGQALMNLISNAIHYQPKLDEHTPSIKIIIQVDKHDDSYVILEIEDNGIGIATEHHEQIFEARTRLHGLQDYTGSGWGLAIVKKIVLEHDGSIGVDSRGIGYGSKFWIRLPRGTEHTASRR